MYAMNKNKRLVKILIAVPILLLIPFFAMQFSSEINWTVFDFLVMGILLTITGVVLEMILRKVPNRENRIALIAIILIAFLLIWAELAVGIFGSPLAGS